MTKRSLFRCAAALAAGLLCSVGSAASVPSPPGPCEDGEETRIQTGMYGYVVYRCHGTEWYYLYECDESGYCFIGPG